MLKLMFHILSIYAKQSFQSIESTILMHLYLKMSMSLLHNSVEFDADQSASFLEASWTWKMFKKISKTFAFPTQQNASSAQSTWKVQQQSVSEIKRGTIKRVFGGSNKALSRKSTNLNLYFKFSSV